LLHCGWFEEFFQMRVRATKSAAREPGEERLEKPGRSDGPEDARVVDQVPRAVATNRSHSSPANKPVTRTMNADPGS
jgi:hypothetical protein